MKKLFSGRAAGFHTARRSAAAFAGAAGITMLTSLAAAQASVAYDGPPVDIPEPGDPETFAVVPLEVSDFSGTIGDLEVIFAGAGPCNGQSGNVAIDHPWVGDLRFVLQSPAGTRVTLIDRPNNGGSGEDICSIVLDDEAVIPFDVSGAGNAPFTGYFTPMESLSAFDGEDPNGTWRLFVEDESGGDRGTLNSVRIAITTAASPDQQIPILLFDEPQEALLVTNQQDATFTGSLLTQGDSLLEAPSTSFINAEDELTIGNVTDESGNGSFATWSATETLTEGSNFFAVTAVTATGFAQISRPIVYDPAFNPPPMLAVTNPLSTPDNEVGVSEGTDEYLFQGTATDDTSVANVSWRNIATDETGSATLSGPQESVSWDALLPLSETVTQYRFVATDGAGAASAPVERTLIRTETNFAPTVSVNQRDVLLPFGTDSVDVDGTALDQDGFVELVEWRVQRETLFRRGLTAGWNLANDLTGDFTQWAFTADTLETPGSAADPPVTNVVQVRAQDNEGLVGPINELRVTIGGEAGQRIPTLTITEPDTDPVQVSSTTPTLRLEGTATGGDAPVTRVEWRRTTPDAATVFQTIPFTQSPGFLVDWSFDVPLVLGDNTIEMIARTSDGNVSPTTDDSTITITREGLSTIAPTLTVFFPANEVQNVNNTIDEILVSGEVTDPDSGVASVFYRRGQNLSDLSEPIPARNDSGDWTEWSFNADLTILTNVFQITAVDSDGNASNSVVRTVIREALPGQVAIVSPPQNDVALNRETSIEVDGVSFDPDDVIDVVEWRVTTDSMFEPGTVPEVSTKVETTPWFEANQVGGDWDEWTFEAPLGVGNNLIEVRGLTDTQMVTSMDSRSIERLPGGDPGDLITATEFMDAWGVENDGGQLLSPNRLGPTGFMHDLDAGWKTLAGDFNGDGLTDLGTVTPNGDFWTVYNLGNFTLGPSTLRLSGVDVNLNNGNGVFAGDFNGDGYSDILQVFGDGSTAVAFNQQNGSFAPLTGTGFIGAVFDPANNWWIEIGDMNGDGRDDIVQAAADPFGIKVGVALETNRFGPLNRWSQSMQFFWDPANESAIHTGDFNGDGRDDAVTVTSGGEAFVSFSNGFLLSAPVSWGVLGYHDDPSRTKGWWTFAFDFTGDGLADYVQLNEFGEIWVAESNGVDAFLQPVLNAPIGFEHKPEGPWQTFPAKVVP